MHATRPTWMEIDLDALARNVREIRRLAGRPVAIVASVKANAYGHGIAPVARRLVAEGVEVLATGSFADAIEMREAGITRPILMMGGALPEAMGELLAHDLMPTVHNHEAAQAVAAAADARAGRRARVYVKVDCGFGRLGIALAEAHHFVLDLARKPGVVVAGLYTHLPFADRDGAAFARERIARFDDLVQGLARDGLHIPVTQSRASGALLAGIDDRCSAVSPGALLYGLSPVEADVGHADGFRPVLAAIRTRLIQVSRHTADTTPGRTGRYAGRVSGPTGVVPFGRLDGNRMPVVGSGAHMLVDGHRAPVLGVSLEHSVLDLSAVPKAAVGQEVVALGGSGGARIGLADLARWQGVGVNDVLMNVNGRMHRQVLA